jgi:hypothetical protein
MINFLKKNKKYVHSVLFFSTFGKTFSEESIKEEVKEEVKESEFRKDLSNNVLKSGSYLSGDVTFKGGFKLEDVIKKKTAAAPFIKTEVEAKGKLFFDFNEESSDDIIKKINASAKIILIKDYFVGNFIKYGVNGVQNLIYLDEFKFYWCPVEKQIKDNLYLKNNVDLYYVSSEYVRNSDAKILELRDTVELKTNIGGQEFKFDPSLGIICNTDNNYQAIKILKEANKFAWTRLFTSSNISLASFFIPAVGVKCNVDHELFRGGLKFFIDPSLGLKEIKDSGYLKWDLLLDFSWKKNLSIVKDIKGSIGFGYDSDMSFFFNDKIDFSDKMYDGSTDDVLLILFRPHLLNLNASCNIDFTSFIEGNDKLWFVSEASTSADLKFEYILGTTVDRFGRPKDAKDVKGAYFRITCDGLKTKLNGSNVENENVKFLLDNLKLDIFKISIGCSPKSLTVDFNDGSKCKFEKLGFDLGITLAKGEFEWNKFGLTFNASILGDGFGVDANKFQWKDLISFGAKWDFAKFWENRNI